MADHPKIPLGWKLWYAFCALVGLAVIGFEVWTLVLTVNRYG